MKYRNLSDSDPEVVIVGEAWGIEEQFKKIPFVGKSGKLLERLLGEVGIERALLTNLISTKPINNDFTIFLDKRKELKEEWVGEVEELKELIRDVRPKLVIGLGNYPLRFLGGVGKNAGIGDWRGSMLWFEEFPFLPTYHPASTFRTYAWRNLIRIDFSKASRFLNGESSWEEPEKNFIVEPSLEKVVSTIDLFNSLSQVEPLYLACDIETRSGFISCIGFAWSTTDAICIPFLSTRRKDGYWSRDGERVIREKLRGLFSNPDIRLIGQNFSFDIQFIFNELLVRPIVAEDTMVKHHTLFPSGGDPTKGTGPQGIVRKSLNNLSSLYCTHHRYWKEEGKLWNTSMPEEQHWIYNCKDCCITYEVCREQDKMLKGMEKQYEFQISQINNLTIPMMLRGVKVDLKARSTATFELQEAIVKVEEGIDKLVPSHFFTYKKGEAPWYRSPAKLSTLFYDILGIKPVYAPGGSRTTGKTALPKIAVREPLVGPIVDRLTLLRSMGVFANTFLTAKLSPDSRMRCSYDVSGTETFRWSSSKNPYGDGGNLQNIPKEKSLSGFSFPDIRSLFIPDPGYMIVDADLMGADAAVVAWETGDEELKDAIRNGIKLHSVVAREREGTDEYPHYDMYKRRIHGTNYGGGPRTMTETLAGQFGSKYSTYRIEEEFQKWWFDRHPKILEWHRKIEQDISERMGVRNVFGYRILYQDRPDTLLNKALAWVPQSTVAITTILGAMEIVTHFREVQLLLQVHDSIVFQIPITSQHKLPQIKKCLNSITIPYPDPLSIPWELKTSTKSWGNCE